MIISRYQYEKDIAWKSREEWKRERMNGRERYLSEDAQTFKDIIFRLFAQILRNYLLVLFLRDYKIYSY